MKHTLVMPYLIQRGKFKDLPKGKGPCRLSVAVSMDYMGSSEFEWGALPKSFRQIESFRPEFKLRVVDTILEDEQPLQVWSFFDDEQFALYEGYLSNLRFTRNTSTKEYTDFNVNDRKTSKVDFWWDIENGVMFGFNKDRMNKVGQHVDDSLAYMNEKDS